MIAELVLATVLLAGDPQPAKPLHSITSSHGDVIELFAEAEPQCPGPGGLKAIYHVNAGTRAGEKVPGCYIIHEGDVLLIFADGDRLRLPLSRFSGRAS